MAFVYRIIEHDDGYAYTADGTVSETFLSREAALAAARKAVAEQRVPGDEVDISYESSDGVWREEKSAGDDRPGADLEA